MERLARIRLLEQAAAELLESETNGSLCIGVDGSTQEPLVITAVGCSVLVAVGDGPAVLMPVSSIRADGGPGARALAEGCDCALRAVHGLPADFTPTVSFGDPVNATRFDASPRRTMPP
jgi:hypothetical protein